MKVRMLKKACGPDGSFNADEEYEISETQARQFLEDRACVPVATPDTEVSSAFPATPIVVPDPSKAKDQDQGGGDKGDAGDDAQDKADKKSKAKGGGK